MSISRASCFPIFFGSFPHKLRMTRPIVRRPWLGFRVSNGFWKIICKREMCSYRVAERAGWPVDLGFTPSRLTPAPAPSAPWRSRLAQPVRRQSPRFPLRARNVIFSLALTIFRAISATPLDSTSSVSTDPRRAERLRRVGGRARRRASPGPIDLVGGAANLWAALRSRRARQRGWSRALDEMVTARREAAACGPGIGSGSWPRSPASNRCSCPLRDGIS